MKNKKIYTFAVLLLAIVLTFAFTAVTISAAEVTMDLSKAKVSEEYTLKDAEGNVFTAYYGLKADDNSFGYEIKPKQRDMHDYIAVSPTAPESKSDWIYGQDYLYCFCIEHGIPLPDKSNYSGSGETGYGNKYEQLSENQKTLLSLALAYGYPNRTDIETSKDANACYSATQLIVWQITLGFRSSATELDDKTYPMDGYTGTMTEQYTDNPYLKEYYDLILTDMTSHYMRPSFTGNVPAMAPSYEMQYADGKYSITLTDTNQVLSNYKVSVSGGATVSINGNQLTISSAKPITNAITIKLNRKMPKTTLTTGFLIWSVAGNEDRNQDMVSGVPANNDPVPAYLKVVSPTGSAKIVKTSEDGKIDGIRFTITGNGVDKTVTTDENGEITISDLTPGIYTVTEHTDNVYEPQEPKTVTIVSGQTTTVSFNNVLKLGHLVVTKTSEDGLTSGVLFRLFGTSESGMYVDKYVATDGSGKAFFTNIPIGSGYILEEVATKDFYITPIEQAVEIEWKQATTKTVSNALKKGELRVIKTAEDGMVEGVTFRLTGTSDSGAKIDLYATTDATGVAIFKDVLIGSNYTLSEENTEFKYITPVSQNTAIEWNHITEKSFCNELKRGDLTVTKTSEDGLVEGITFRLYGTAECDQHVDVYATTDSSGKAYFKAVLIGSAYTLEECDESEKYITPIAQTNVSVEWNRVSERAFYNELKRGSLTVTKTADDGLVSGITFRLYGTSLSGENVDLQATTNESGKAIFSDVLIGSNYTLEEVATDSKYMTPLEQTVVIQWAKVTFAEMHNALNHGELLIIKTSENGKVDGVRFTITGNGVNKTVMTDSNGEIKIQDLLPGTYTVTEQNEDYYEPQPTKTVTVVYNQTAAVHFENILKRGDLTVTKTSEDGLTEGIRFRLTGTSDSGAKIDVTATVDSTGKAYFKDVLIGSGYTLEEVNTDFKYIAPDSQNVEIEWNTVTSAHVHNTLKRGDLKVVKTSEDNFVDGIKFRLYGTSLSGEKIDVFAYTDKEGVARFNDILIGEHYTVEEVDPDERYIIPDSQTVVIEWNMVTQKSFYNELKRGTLKIIKTAEDNLVEGIKFRLYGTSHSGEKVDIYAYTDKNGVAFFKNIPIGQNYTVEEVDTSLRYVVPKGQNIDISWNEITEVEIHNVLKKWRAEVFKIDRALSNEHVEIQDELLPRLFTLTSHEQVNVLGAPYGQSQGDATLEGAVYGVYKDGALIDTYITDKNGYFITDYYPCYENVEWMIREISPSEGYLLDETVYYIDTYAGQYTVELNTVYPDVYEDIIKGKITIIKHTDDGSTKIETPEVGAMFEIYLKSAGSYEAAENTERDILTCDEFGYAETIDLPYGVYVVKQIKGWEGRELLDPFEVFVSEDGEIYRYLINNANFESYLHVVKVDSTTGNTIPYAGAGFQICAPDGQLVTMSYTYPTLTVIDTFYTDENGTLLTPEKLPYGKGYSLVEVQAPHGYVLDATPIYFDVTKENSADENGITIVKVVKENEPQKGTITITKTGKVFSSVAEQNGVYQPLYEIKDLAGAVYEITAAEDVITLDGTIRYKKGDVVATITTGADGTATTDPLFLGKFKIQGITAPYGMLLNGDTVTVELTYAGQEINITTTSVAFVNERQKVEIDLTKALEQDEKYGIGMNGEITAVQFGLYASDYITAADGKVIPKDGLIETVTCDENGKAVFGADLPVGAKVYVKEIATDNHYILSDSTHPVIFDYAGQDTAVVKISVNSGEAIENEIIRGSIIGKKLDEDGFTICGALFGLFRENETVFTEETALATCQSNEIGIFTFENVPFGRWIVREIKAAPAFVLNENSYTVTVGTDEEVIEITIENEFITGSVKTTKVDKEYPDNKLTGAVFEIYVDMDGNGEFNPELDLLVGEMAETEDGIYEMHDLRYNGYFLYEKTAPEGFLKDEDYHYFEIRNDGETVIVENEAGVGFVNNPLLANLKIVKSSTDGQLEGFSFRITGPNYDAVYTTDSGGEIFVENLRIGNYTITEILDEASEGYLLPSPIEAELLNGETLTIEVYNEKLPQTGDDSSLFPWFVLMLLSMGGLIGVFVYTQTKKRYDL